MILLFQNESYIAMKYFIVRLTMATQVYTFFITYEGLDDKIWRKVQVSSNYRLDQLGYLLLATFDTLAYHLFALSIKVSALNCPMLKPVLTISWTLDSSNCISSKWLLVSD